MSFTDDTYLFTSFTSVLRKPSITQQIDFMMYSLKTTA